ncbi:SDR family oxidoreductase [Saccharopolyspora thermophila]|uniref:SDR family oxidoreductase n=1 Tax=Saccharopolyspora thermophila TaxID=89367 RepID=UPI001667CAAD|nr:SDR family oxidoreductase [Saccharopolyspora subtropica]
MPTREHQSTSSLDLFRLHGRAAIVTGAARGLGRAMALALAEAGSDIVALDVAPLADLARDVESRGVLCHAHQADLRSLSPSTAQELISRALSAAPNTTVLVNNAGTIRRGPALHTSAEDWHAVIDLNLTTPFMLAQAFARALTDTGTSGSVINIASINSFQGGVEVPAYAAAKHGLLGLTRALANEWTAHGVRVNAIAPGYMLTDFTAAHRQDSTRYEAMRDRMPANRWGNADDLAGAVVYLASSASNYVTGSVLTVDGGWLAR